MSLKVAPCKEQAQISGHSMTYIETSKGRWLAMLILSAVLAVAPAAPGSGTAVPAEERAALASQIKSASEKLLSVKIESEAWIERRASPSEPWERTPIYVAATGWFDGRSARARVDVHSEVLEWHDGAAPYYESSYTIAFDGSTGVIVHHAFGYKGNLFPKKQATILGEAPRNLRDPGWVGQFTGIEAAGCFLSRYRAHDLAGLVRADGKSLSATDGLVSEVRRVRPTETGTEELQIDVPRAQGPRISYRLDPSRGFALLESKEIVIGKDGREKVRFRVDVSRLQEVVPGVWYPTEAAFEHRHPL